MLKSINKLAVPMLVSGVLLVLFKPVYCNGQEINYLLIWILSGLPFGIGKLNVLMIAGKMDLSGSLAVLVFDYIIAGLIGGFVAIWYMLELAVKLMNFIVGCAIRRKIA